MGLSAAAHGTLHVCRHALLERHRQQVLERLACTGRTPRGRDRERVARPMSTESPAPRQTRPAESASASPCWSPMNPLSSRTLQAGCPSHTSPSPPPAGACAERGRVMDQRHLHEHRNPIRQRRLGRGSRDPVRERSEDDLPFLGLRYVQGSTLTTTLAGGPEFGDGSDGLRRGGRPESRRTQPASVQQAGSDAAGTKRYRRYSVPATHGSRIALPVYRSIGVSVYRCRRGIAFLLLNPFLHANPSKAFLAATNSIRGRPVCCTIAGGAFAAYPSSPTAPQSRDRLLGVTDQLGQRTFPLQHPPHRPCR